MTATQTSITAADQVRDRTRAQRQGRPTPGWFSPIDHKDDSIEYVVRTEADTGLHGMGEVLDISTTSGQSSFDSRAPLSGKTR